VDLLRLTLDNSPISGARWARLGTTPASVDSENYGNYDDPQEIDLYQKMLRETDPARQRALMRRFENYVLDEQAHAIWVLWWHRIVPYRSYVKGFKISPTHFINQDLATIWLDK
jgi:peptide/nickel transport system substrate-binding protein